MKPNFALTLSFEGIGLLHRAFPGWHLVGEINLDSSDLAGDLRRMREKAIALDPSGLHCKLVIPNDQIRYLSFDPQGADVSSLPDLVKRHLDGATPYALEALVYDWSQSDGVVSVAAVARDTLTEAEAFAQEHKFNPVCFVAVPENNDFSGEPFFGETSCVKGVIGRDVGVTRDTAPIRVIGAAKLPEVETPEDIAGNEAQEGGEQVEPESEGATPITTKDPSPETAPEEVLGFAEPATTYEPPQSPEADATADSTESTADVATFASSRARDPAVQGSIPELSGVERHFNPAPVSVDVVADSLPGDPGSDHQKTEIAPESEGLANPLTVPPAPPEIRPNSPPDHSAFTSRGVTPVAPVVGKRPEIPTTEEQQRMTIFGARDRVAENGMSKLLVMIASLVFLMVLAGIAIWFFFFLDNGQAGVTPEETGIIIADVPALPESSSDPEVATTLPEDVTAAREQTDEEIDTALREALGDPNPVELTEDEARARYAATGIWLIPPDIPNVPAVGSLDEFYQTSIDSEMRILDAVALPGVEGLGADTRPETPNSPARAGTTFKLDERGLVVATPQGAISPDGILIHSGPPPSKPPAMPKRVIVADVVAEIDPAALRLAAFRPRTRPADLTEQNERGNLSGRTRVELARLRPRTRPQTIQPIAQQSPEQIATDTPEQTTEQTSSTPFIDLDAVNSAITEAVESDFDTASAAPQAVRSSLKPHARPKNFDSLLNGRNGGSDASLTVSATQRVAPRIPTTSNVAKRATEKNVLKMRKINLIGVYGSPNSRRALIRLSNGRYRKVKVGDRLDGGKVSAIGDSELRYQKSGRNVVLKMPRG